MINFELSPKQLELKERARTFVQEEFLPRRSELDEHNVFPRELMEAAREQSFLGLYLPTHLGGPGASMMDLAVVTEEFGYGDLGLMTSLMVGVLATGPILYFGTPEQQDRWLGPLARTGSFCSLAMTEPDAGSSAFALATTTARRVDGGFSLTGKKCYITNAEVASFIVVFAKIEGQQGTSAFVVPRNADGLEISMPYKKLGQRASNTCLLNLDGVYVEEAQLIGREGQGATIAATSLNRSRMLIGVAGVGVARAARDHVLDWAWKRKTSSGGRLGANPLFRQRVADWQLSIETGRLLCWRACWEFDKSGPHGEFVTKYASLAKLHGGNIAVQITGEAVESMGGLGFMEEGRVEKLMRDAKVLQIYEGTSAVQRSLIAGHAARRPRRKRPEVDRGE
jgi:acyl-CoA dehydrogenase